MRQWQSGELLFSEPEPPYNPGNIVLYEPVGSFEVDGITYTHEPDEVTNSYVVYCEGRNFMSLKDDIYYPASWNLCANKCCRGFDGCVQDELGGKSVVH